jgi:hypothetical protein
MGGNTHRCETMGGSVGGKVDRPSYRWAIVIMFLEYAGWSATLSVLPKLETEFFGANAILVSTIAKGRCIAVPCVARYKQQLMCNRLNSLVELS